jgi:type II secretory pathway pseudopilin PulG
MIKIVNKKPILVVAAVGVVFILITLLLWFGDSTAIRKAKVAKAQANLVAIQTSLSVYHREFGRFPTGSSSSILSDLMGANPRGIRFLVLSGSGSPPFLDPWGEAYILIPASSSGGPEFYSKGPDRIDDSCSPLSDDMRSGKP